MSRTYKGSKGSGFEYGKSRLHRGYETPGRFTKRLTHKKERHNGKKDLRIASEDYSFVFEEYLDWLEDIHTIPFYAQKEFWDKYYDIEE